MKHFDNLAEMVCKVAKISNNGMRAEKNTPMAEGYQKIVWSVEAAVATRGLANLAPTAARREVRWPVLVVGDRSRLTGEELEGETTDFSLVRSGRRRATLAMRI